MTTSRIIGTAIVVAIALTGCAAQGQPPEAPPSLSSGEGATAEPTSQARETGLVAPAQVFGGACDAVFTAAEISAAVGLAVTQTARGNSPDSDPIEQLGGMECSWSNEADPGSVSVWIFVFPDGAVTYDPPSDVCESQTVESGDPVCLLEATESGIRLSGLIMAGSMDAAMVQTARSTLLDLFAQRAAAAEPTPLPLPAIGAWEMPVQCESVVAGADLSTVAGLGAGSTGEGSGGRGGHMPYAVTGLHGDDDLPFCLVVGESAEVPFTALGGMRWKGQQTAEAGGATPLTVDGLDSVYVSPTRNGGFTVDVLDGPNWLQFHVQFTKNAPGIATALVAALDATGAA